MVATGGGPLGELTWPEVGAAGPLALLVPLGATEQHGPHLPLDTDTRVAVALAASVAARWPGRVVVAPAVPYGSSGEHAGFPGTLSLGQHAFELLLVELVRSIGPPVTATVLVNGHGGNLEPLARAVALLAGEGRSVTAWSARVEGGDAHAGRTETSLVLALAPHLVRAGRAEPGDTRPIAALLPELRRVGVVGVSANGVLGDPAGASAAEGHALLASLARDLARHVEGVVARHVEGIAAEPVEAVVPEPAEGRAADPGGDP